MEIVCERKYGEPKLKKPKCLNNKTLLGSVNFNKTKCKLWKVENEYYLLVRDWFSPFISFDKAEKLGIINSYYKKFIYNDNFGGVVLRNEAIIKFAREEWQKPYCTANVNLCCQLEKLLNIRETHLWNYNWLNMFEQCVVLAGYNCLDVEKSFKTIDLKELI